MNGLLAELREFLRLRRSAAADEFPRTLPFGDYVSDRWDKARALGFGEGTSIYDSAHVFGDVSVGRNTWIGPFTILDGSGGATNFDWYSPSNARRFSEAEVREIVAANAMRTVTFHAEEAAYAGRFAHA